MIRKGAILIADDTASSLRLLSDILREEGYEVRSAISGEVALKSAIGDPPELVLLDVRMPIMDGYEVCRQLKSRPETRHLPVIFVSALSDIDDKVQGFTLGAVDFVSKPFQREELLARVRTHLELYRLRNRLEDLVGERTRELKMKEERLQDSVLELEAANEALRQQEEEISYLAFYDPLTQLPNRRLFLDRLQHALAGSGRRQCGTALLFIDLDNFKSINDTYGHAVGDRLLVAVAQRLVDDMRDGDTIARLGGDEFVIILENLDNCPQGAAAQAEDVSENILFDLAQPYLIDEKLYISTPSIGVTLFFDNTKSIDDILKQADIAMYQAKSSGRNAARFFDPVMQTVISARTSLEAALRQGIQERQFVVHYQPQIDGGIIGAEVLLRWRHPERGMVSPAEFIPLAEECGLILPIGQWVLDTACRQLGAWARDPVTRDLTLAVNVSARQFRQIDFVKQVRETLDLAEAPVHRLKIELTESLVVEDVTDTIKKMRALKELGVSFSMDDFGTGYSSLSYLRHLPLDQIKIDQSFVRNLPDSSGDAVLVQTIITMAKSLGLEVVAEGVETRAQQQFLDRHGCSICQGYLFSPPVPPAQFEQLLRDNHGIHPHYGDGRERDLPPSHPSQ